jgi:hypothetical protein
VVQLKRYYFWLLLTGALSNLAVFSARFFSVFGQNGLEATSGLEGGGAFGIYLICTKQSVYHDFSQLPNPFTFNFLFYGIYGYLVRILSYCDATPVIGRFITLSLLIAAAGLVWCACRPVLEKFEAGALALALVSPTIGWWAFSLRPDVAGAAFLMAALLFFFYYLEYSQLWMMLVSGFCLLCAWGFKQPYAFVAPIMLAYTFARNRSHSIALLLLLALGFCAPLLLYNPNLYVLHTVKIPSGYPFYPFLALTNSVTFFSKAFGILLPAALIGWITVRSAPLRSGINFLFITFVSSFVLFIVLSSKLGAGDYYFFPTLVAGILVFGLGSTRVHESLRRSFFLIFTLITLGQSALLLSGIRGKMDLPEDTIKFTPVLSATLAKMPGPKMVWHQSLGLPWNTPSVETRIFDSYVDFDAAVQIPGGINVKSLLANGFYATVAIPVETQDLIDPSKYRLKRQIGPLLIFARIKDVPITMNGS